MKSRIQTLVDLKHIHVTLGIFPSCLYDARTRDTMDSDINTRVTSWSGDLLTRAKDQRWIDCHPLAA